MGVLPEDFDAALAVIRRHLHDHKWLSRHEVEIFERMQRDGLAAYRIHQVCDVLAKLLEYFLNQPTRPVWHKLVGRLLDVAIEGNVDDQLSNLSYIHSKYLLQMRETQSAVTSLRMTRQNANFARNADILVKVNLEILQCISLRAAEDLNPAETYERMRRYAEETTTPETRVVVLMTLAKYELHHLSCGAGLAYIWEAYATLAHIIYDEETLYGSLMWETQTMLIDILLVMGMLYRHDGQYSPAHLCLMEALSYTDTDDHVYQLAFIHHELGWLAKAKLHYDDATYHLSLAKTGFEATGSAVHLTAVNHSLGIVLTETGDYKRAYKLLKDALAEYSQITHSPHIVDVLHAVGYLYQKQGNFQRALHYLHKAERAAKEWLRHMPERRTRILEEIRKDIAVCQQANALN